MEDQKRSAVLAERDPVVPHHIAHELAGLLDTASFVLGEAYAARPES